MLGTSRPWRLLLAALAVAAAAGTVRAQIPPETVPVVPVPGENLLPPSVLETVPFPQNPPPALASATPTDIPDVLDRRALPGSLTDQVQRDYAARDLFRYCTANGTTFTGFPTTLLWEPPMASKREPRMQALVTDFANYANNWTLDTSIGMTHGLLRVEPAGSDLKLQFDLFGVVFTRLSPDDLIAADYRFGFPVTFSRGEWHGKIGYEHTSAHLGDEGMLFGGLQRTRYAKDEFVLGLGRWFHDCLRVYGQYSYAGYQDLPQQFSRNRYDAGFELYDRRPTGWCGTPFAAVHWNASGETNHTPNTNIQLGWLWRNPELRLAQLRLFGEYYNGNSPYGQLFAGPREQFFGFGLAGDY